MKSGVLLTADWRYLAMINYEVDPAVLLPLVPQGTHLDCWKGRALVSMVGFLFLKTKVFGAAVPFHRSFEEVNLRFYVKRRAGDEWRRGVVFVKEIVPRRAVAALARALYNENYRSMPMRHRIEEEAVCQGRGGLVEFEWRLNGHWNRLALRSVAEARSAASGSEEEFITEHYWGYTAEPDGGCIEFRVEHPSWRVWQTSGAVLECRIADLYGSGFLEALSQPPVSSFLAEGSHVKVWKGART